MDTKRTPSNIKLDATENTSINWLRIDAQLAAVASLNRERNGTETGSICAWFYRTAYYVAGGASTSCLTTRLTDLLLRLKAYSDSLYFEGAEDGNCFTGGCAPE